MREHVLDVWRHGAGKQLGQRQGLGRPGALRAPPLVLGQELRADSHAVGRVAGALHLGEHDAGLDLELGDLAAARVAASAFQPRAHAEGFQQLEEASRPPRLSVLARRQATDRRQRTHGLELRGAHQAATASLESATSLRSWAVSSSVNHASPLPTTLSASSRLEAINSSMRSSSVPTHVSLRTWTFLRWPIRNARSVAWSSTAGFHQRSKWMTWLAAVRLSPVPPAFSDSTNSDGPSSAWKRATISSRAAFGVPPCRKSTSRPVRSCKCARRSWPNSANCVKQSARSPCPSASSTISSSRESFPERPSSRERSRSR